jgi:hypothetical protein
MWTLLKVLTLPIWLPIKILWTISKVLAFVIFVALLVLIVWVCLHVC